MSNKSCFYCIHFKPNIHYPFLGLCTIKDKNIVERVEICDSYRGSSLEELKKVLKTQGWLYCLTCRKTIVDEEELEEHVREHVVISGVIIDEAVPEEAPSGD